MNKTTKRIGGGLAGLAFVVGVCKGINWLYEQANKPMPEPKIEFLDEELKLVEDIDVFVPRTRYGGRGNLFVIDEDNDGLADVLRYLDSAEWIAEGHTSKYFAVIKRTKTMTPEMRDAASRLLRARKDLYFETWKKVYELEKERIDEESRK
ncbi:hypothetical protein HY450_03395 [Candidatus Pacearchaeota archaeon]|nr:hypothetical protein [Candidatus Pacearchaeota archaeon]